jgi:hypothetical protein
MRWFYIYPPKVPLCRRCHSVKLVPLRGAQRRVSFTVPAHHFVSCCCQALLSIFVTVAKWLLRRGLLPVYWRPPGFVVPLLWCLALHFPCSVTASWAPRIIPFRCARCRNAGRLLTWLPPCALPRKYCVAPSVPVEPTCSRDDSSPCAVWGAPWLRCKTDGLEWALFLLLRSCGSAPPPLYLPMLLRPPPSGGCCRSERCYHRSSDEGLMPPQKLSVVLAALSLLALHRLLMRLLFLFPASACCS